MFNDLALLDNTAIQRLLREIDSMDLAVALKGESDTVKEKFLSNMSPRAADMIEEHIGLMTDEDVTKESIKEAQEKIMSIVQKLIDTGEISLPDEDELQYEHEEGKYDGEI